MSAHHVRRERFEIPWPQFTSQSADLVRAVGCDLHVALRNAAVLVTVA